MSGLPTKDERRAAFQRIFSGKILKRSLFIAAVTGVVLNVINQGDALFGDAPLNRGRAALTFMVPFVVSSVSAFGAALDRLRERASDLPQP